jgi:hypothetical protein
MKKIALFSKWQFWWGLPFTVFLIVPICLTMLRIPHSRDFLVLHERVKRELDARFGRDITDDIHQYIKSYGGQTKFDADFDPYMDTVRAIGSGSLQISAQADIVRPVAECMADKILPVVNTLSELSGRGYVMPKPVYASSRSSVFYENWYSFKLVPTLIGVSKIHEGKFQQALDWFSKAIQICQLDLCSDPAFSIASTNILSNGMNGFLMSPLTSEQCLKLIDLLKQFPPAKNVDLIFPLPDEDIKQISDHPFDPNKHPFYSALLLFGMSNQPNSPLPWTNQAGARARLSSKLRHHPVKYSAATQRLIAGIDPQVAYLYMNRNISIWNEVYPIEKLSTEKLELAFAARSYLARTGKWPRDLHELLPGYLSELPAYADSAGPDSHNPPYLTAGVEPATPALAARWLLGLNLSENLKAETTSTAEEAHCRIHGIIDANSSVNLGLMVDRLLHSSKLSNTTVTIEYTLSSVGNDDSSDWKSVSTAEAAYLFFKRDADSHTPCIEQPIAPMASKIKKWRFSLDTHFKQPLYVIRVNREFFRVLQTGQYANWASSGSTTLIANEF